LFWGAVNDTTDRDGVRVNASAEVVQVDWNRIRLDRPQFEALAVDARVPCASRGLARGDEGTRRCLAICRRAAEGLLVGHPDAEKASNRIADRLGGTAVQVCFLELDAFTSTGCEPHAVIRYLGGIWIAWFRARAFRVSSLFFCLTRLIET